MATTKDYKDFILDGLSLLEEITYRKMMGEYLLYYNGVLFGGIYDNRLLVKIVESNKKYNMRQSIPYAGAKPMYLVDDVNNKESLRNIVLDTCKDLKENKKWANMNHCGNILKKIIYLIKAGNKSCFLWYNIARWK